MTSVYSSPKRLQWYHWTLIVAESFAVLLVLVVGFFSSPESRREFSRTLALGFMMILIWYRSAYSMLRKTAVIEYNDDGILRLQNTAFTISGPVLYSNIKEALRRSESCLKFTFKDALVPSESMSKTQGRVTELDIEANEDDLDTFSKYLSLKSVPVLKDPIPDDDPRKEHAALILGLIFVVALMFSGLWIATRFAK